MVLGFRIKGTVQAGPPHRRGAGIKTGQLKARDMVDDSSIRDTDEKGGDHIQRRVEGFAGGGGCSRGPRGYF